MRKKADLRVEAVQKQCCQGHVLVSDDEQKQCQSRNQSGGGRNEDNFGGLSKGLDRRGPRENGMTGNE